MQPRRLISLRIFVSNYCLLLFDWLRVLFFLHYQLAAVFMVK